MSFTEGSINQKRYNIYINGVKGLKPGVISKVGCEFDRPGERSPE